MFFADNQELLPYPSLYRALSLSLSLKPTYVPKHFTTHLLPNTYLHLHAIQHDIYVYNKNSNRWGRCTNIATIKCGERMLKRYFL